MQSRIGSCYRGKGSRLDISRDFPAVRLYTRELSLTSMPACLREQEDEDDS